MTLTVGLSAPAARRRGINTSREERMNNRRMRDFMDETFSAIRQNRQALSGGPCSRMVAAEVRRRILARKTLPPSRRASVSASLRRDGGPPRYLGGYGACDDS